MRVRTPEDVLSRDIKVFERRLKYLESKLDCASENSKTYILAERNALSRQLIVMKERKKQYEVERSIFSEL